jgi:hypothetical protein
MGPKSLQKDERWILHLASLLMQLQSFNVLTAADMFTRLTSLGTRLGETAENPIRLSDAKMQLKQLVDELDPLLSSSGLPMLLHFARNPSKLFIELINENLDKQRRGARANLKAMPQDDIFFGDDPHPADQVNPQQEEHPIEVSITNFVSFLFGKFQ